MWRLLRGLFAKMWARAARKGERTGESGRRGTESSHRNRSACIEFSQPNFSQIVLLEKRTLNSQEVLAYCLFPRGSAGAACVHRSVFRATACTRPAPTINILVLSLSDDDEQQVLHNIR